MPKPSIKKKDTAPGVELTKKPRGRPPLPGAKTDAERAREYRARKKARRVALRDPETPPTSKILDLSGDIARAIEERDKRQAGQVRQAKF